MSIAITLLALLVEATLGYPDRVLRAIGHPVMWSGRMIGSLDATLNRDTSSSGRRRAAGFVTAFVVAALPAATAILSKALFCCCLRLRDRRDCRQQPDCPARLANMSSALRA
jgi:adenosylcobinamide-phosphate synthase